MSGLNFLTRDEVIDLMRLQKKDYAGLFKRLDDQFAGLYHLTPSGKLVNWKGNAVGKTVVFEGWLDYKDGKPIKKTWGDMNNEG